MISNVQFDFLGEEKIKKILDAVYTVLGEVGMQIGSEEALKIFAEAGATVEGNIVKIPREVVEKAIASAPSHIQIYDRNGKEAMLLGGRNSYLVLARHAVISSIRRQENAEYLAKKMQRIQQRLLTT